jgi:hypothetical protein
MKNKKTNDEEKECGICYEKNIIQKLKCQCKNHICIYCYDKW